MASSELCENACALNMPCKLVWSIKRDDSLDAHQKLACSRLYTNACAQCMQYKSSWTIVIKERCQSADTVTFYELGVETYAYFTNAHFSDLRACLFCQYGTLERISFPLPPRSTLSDAPAPPRPHSVLSRKFGRSLTAL